MWKLLLVIMIISVAFFFVRKQQQKQQKHTRDRTGELLELEHIKDIPGKDLMDNECKRIMQLVI
jgi:hypothetical protein